MSRAPGRTQRQFAKYVIVGLLSNASMIGLYVLLTMTLAGPKTAMTITYCVGVLVAFVANRHWTFGDQKSRGNALGRYLLAYALGYVINYVVLLICVDLLGLPHLYVQTLMIILLAIMLFALQKYWVFRTHEAH